MARNGHLKIAVISAGLGGAALVSLLAWSSDAAPPNEGGRLTYWTCTECGRAFSLTIDEFQNAKVQGATSRAAGPRTRQSGSFETVRCAECGKLTAAASFKCEHHDVIYPRRARDGSRGRCARCAGE